MNKNITKVQVDERRWRWTVTISDVPSEPGPSADARQFPFLQALLFQPTLLNCGLSPFETMKVSHTGECWSAVLVAVTEYP